MSLLRELFTGRVPAEKIWRCREKAISTSFPPLKKWYSARYSRLMLRYGAHIPLEARFEGPPVFPHGPSGIFVSQAAVIGKNCTLFHQVTIGSNTLRDSRGFGAPVIGNDVYIGCGAKIIGNVRIGNHVLIGANCVVTRDVPDNSTVILPEPRILTHNTPRDTSFTPWDAIDAGKKPDGTP